MRIIKIRGRRKGDRHRWLYLVDGIAAFESLEEAVDIMFSEDMRT